MASINFVEIKLSLQLNNFVQKLDFGVLWFRRRAYKLYKNNHFRQKRGTGMKEYLKTAVFE